MKLIPYLSVLVMLFSSCVSEAQKKDEANTNKKFEVQKSDEEWKEVLTSQQYYVLRKAGTEPAYSSPLNHIDEKGTFVCAACGNELYQSEHQFDSGTGWPSFDRAVEGSLATGVDYKLGYKRDEAICGKCGGHLGHIFSDGPRATTGMRHCINGAALEFVPENNK